MTVVLTEAVQLTETRAKIREDIYRMAVDAAAAGEDVPADQLADAIEAAGKSADEFQADVKYKSERLRLKALADGYQQHQAELTAAREQVAKLEAELEQTAAALRSKIVPLATRANELTDLLTQAKQAGRDLFARYEGPLRDQLVQAQRRADSAALAVRENRSHLCKLQQQLDAVKERPEKFTANALTTTQCAVDRRRTELAESELARDAAGNEVTRLTIAMRQP